jgi:bifunctional non-homologous end joining protein LigD
VEGKYFYEKQCPSHRPDWIKTTQVPKGSGEIINYCLMNDLPALVWAANLADLELHTFLHRAPAIDRPTSIVFDLDPGPPADIVLCCQVALILKSLFKSLGLESFAKTSGSKGMQVYLPLNSPTSYEKTKTFARAVADLLAEREPAMVVAQMSKQLRRGKVFVDWSQNDDGKTTVAVYSLRARDEPTVSTPLLWSEVAEATREQNPASLVFRADEVLERVETHGDLFEPVLTLKQKLPSMKQWERAAAKA